MAAHAGVKPGAEQVGNGAGPETVISVSGLVKRYGEVEAVRGIDFPYARAACPK